MPKPNKLADKMANMKPKKKILDIDKMREADINKTFGEMTPNIGMKKYIKQKGTKPKISGKRG